MGFIFYPKSPRFFNNPDIAVLEAIPNNIQKVGVFVNDSPENILTHIHRYRLDAIQLHGAENAPLCRLLKEEADILIIKAFPIMNVDNLKVTKGYEDIVDLFLFDTKTDIYGGSGEKFDWDILLAYRGEKKFLLSGGIGPNDVKAIRRLQHPQMLGVDLNSRFELKPGLKNVEKLNIFMEQLSQPFNPNTEEDING